MSYLTKLFSGNSKKLDTSLLLPLLNVVVLPGVTLPVMVVRSRSVEAVEMTTLTSHKQLVIATVRPEKQERFDQDRNAEIESLLFLPWH